MGCGYSQMNELVILQTCQGIIQHLYKFENEKQNER